MATNKEQNITYELNRLWREADEKEKAAETDEHVTFQCGVKAGLGAAKQAVLKAFKPA